MTPAQKLKAMVEAATRLPWHSRRNDQDGGAIHYDVDDADEREIACVRHALPHNARLIVLAVNIMPQLAEWLEARAAFRDLPQDVGYADYREASRRLTYVTDALLSALSEQLEKA